MIEIQNNTLEERILRVLLSKYPITVSELQRELNVSMKIVERALQKLRMRGIIALEPLPDKTYIRLLRTDFNFIGRKATQHRPWKRKRKKHEPEEYEGSMYH